MFKLAKSMKIAAKLKNNKEEIFLKELIKSSRIKNIVIEIINSIDSL